MASSKVWTWPSVMLVLSGCGPVLLGTGVGSISGGDSAGEGAPRTSLVSTPDAVSNSAAARFEFGASRAVAGFDVSLDGGPFEFVRESSYEITGLADGQHSLVVAAAVSSNGDDRDPEPPEFVWEVDTGTPAALLEFELREDPPGTFELRLPAPASDGGSTLEYQLSLTEPNAPAGSGGVELPEFVLRETTSSEQVYTVGPLAAAREFNVAVSVVDAAGNASSPLAALQFTRSGAQPRLAVGPRIATGIPAGAVAGDNLRLADVDGDGVVDLYAVTFAAGTGQMTVALGDRGPSGELRFLEPTTSSFPHVETDLGSGLAGQGLDAPQVADFDGDGVFDVLDARVEPGTFFGFDIRARVHSGRSESGAFSLSAISREEFLFGDQPTDQIEFFGSGDFDADGVAEALFVINQLPFVDEFFIGIGDPFPEFLAGFGATDDWTSLAAFGDFDADLIPDLLTVTENGRGRIARRRSGLTPIAQFDLPGPARDFVVQDVDGDGDSDVLGLLTSGEFVTGEFNRSSVLSVTARVDEDYAGATSILAVDFSSDPGETPALVFYDAAANTSRIEIIRDIPDSQGLEFETLFAFDVSGRVLGAARVDPDEFTDILVLDGSELLVLSGVGAVPQPALTFSAPIVLHAVADDRQDLAGLVACNDLDFDGHDEVMTVEVRPSGVLGLLTETFRLFEVDPDGSFEQVVRSREFPSTVGDLDFSELVVFDCNGDGIPDIQYVGSQLGSFAGGAFLPGVLNLAPRSFSVASFNEVVGIEQVRTEQLGFIDDDARPDLLIGNGTQVFVQRQAPNLAGDDLFFEPPVVLASFGIVVEQVLYTDLDHDNLGDILVHDGLTIERVELDTFGVPSLGPETLVTLDAPVNSVACRQLDDDLFEELVAVNVDPGPGHVLSAIQVIDDPGDGPDVLEIENLPAWTAVLDWTFADMLGEGYAQLIYLAEVGGEFRVGALSLRNGSDTPLLTVEPVTDNAGLAVGDLDGDGVLDLVVEGVRRPAVGFERHLVMAYLGRARRD